MKNQNKPRKITLSIVDELLNETTELEKVQLSDRLDLAIRIEKLIKDQGFKTHKQFADHIHRSVSEVSRWLSGYHNITQNTLSEIAHGLDLRLCDLFNTEVNVQIYSSTQIISSQPSSVQKKSWKEEKPLYELNYKSTEVTC